MILPDHYIKNYIENILTEKQIQPASIELTVAKVYKYKSSGGIYTDKKEAPELEEVQPKKVEVDGKTREIYELEPGCYKIQFNEIVKIPEKCGAITINRSTIHRFGAFITPGFWDPGYVGRGEALLVVFNPHGIKIEKGARVVQMIFFELKERPKDTYKGDYKYENI